MTLYVTAPLFASSMSLDEGSRFQGWLSSFVMQLLGSFGCVVTMRLYLLMVPIITSKEFNFFQGENLGGFVDGLGLDYFAQLVFLLGGAWAVSKANTLIVGALSNNPASSVLEADSMAGGVAGKLTGAYAKAFYALPKWGMGKAMDAAVRKFTGGAVGADDLKKAAGKDKDSKGGALPNKLISDTTSEQGSSKTSTSSTPSTPSTQPPPKTNNENRSERELIDAGVIPAPPQVFHQYQKDVKGQAKPDGVPQPPPLKLKMPSKPQKYQQKLPPKNNTMPAPGQPLPNRGTGNRNPVNNQQQVPPHNNVPNVNVHQRPGDPQNTQQVLNRVLERTNINNEGNNGNNNQG
jgi:hypothetical protein